jgi:meiotically up-regulated gene 157 (Mug157) protein
MFLMNTFLILSILCLILDNTTAFSNERPPMEKRTYTSKTINDLIDNLSPFFKDDNLAILFGNTLPNTLDTTVYYSGQSDTNIDGDLDSFIITGDIDALWLRDSANQVVPYLPYLAKDNDLQSLIKGLISRHARSVTIDSFANSFNFNKSGDGHQSDLRKPPMTKGVFEGISLYLYII